MTTHGGFFLPVCFSTRRPADRLLPAPPAPHHFLKCQPGQCPNTFLCLQFYNLVCVACPGSMRIMSSCSNACLFAGGNVSAW